MATDVSRYLAYADVREATSNAEKAVLLVLNYGLSQKAAARALGVNLNVVRKAVKANKEGRIIGRKGRPPKLNEDEKGELKSTVEKMIKEHKSPTKRGIAAEVCP
jgi:transposase